MTGKLTEEGPSRDPVPVFIVPSCNLEDSIRFRDLVSVVIRRKWMVLATILLSIAGFAVYVMFAEPVYRAESTLLPPSQQHIQGLSVDISDNVSEGLKSYTPEDVYAEFQKNLKSLGLRREFFLKNKLIDIYVVGDSPDVEVNADEIFTMHFSNAMRMSQDRQNSAFINVSFDNADPEIAAQVLNRYIEFVNKQTVGQLLLDVKAAISTEITRLRHQIDKKLKFAERRKEDTVIALREALQIATALGIKDTSTFPTVMDQNGIGLVVNTAQVPLYLRGVKALEAEIKVLESRESQEPFATGVRDLQERVAYLEGISTDRGELSAVNVDVPAMEPQRMRSPRVTSLLLLSVILGTVLGVIFAFMYEFLKSSGR